MADITIDFITMMIFMVMGYILLIFVPLSWVPSATLTLLSAHYEVEVTDCREHGAAEDGVWYLMPRAGFCNSDMLECEGFDDYSFWHQLDILNRDRGIDTQFVEGATQLDWVEPALVVGLIFVCCYATGFVMMVNGLPNQGMVCQGLSLLASFFAFGLAFRIEDHAEQVNAESWEVQFPHCDVSVTPSAGFTMVQYLVGTQTILVGCTLCVWLVFQTYKWGILKVCPSSVSPRRGGGERASLISPNTSNYASTTTGSVKKVLMLMSATGGGHRASAEALSTAMKQIRGDAVEIEILDIWATYANWPFTDIVNHYRIFTQYPWLWKISYDFAQFPITRLLSEIIEHVTTYDSFRDAIMERDADVIVSVHPLCQHLPNMIVREINQERRNSSKIPVVFVTVVTDLCSAHASWFSPETAVTFCPTEELKQAAIQWGSGVTEEQFVVHGLPIRPPFWSPQTVSKATVRTKLRLNPDLRSILLMAGGDGVGNIKAQANAIAKKLSEAAFNSQIVVICGHNKAMEADLKSEKQKWPTNVQVVVLGFTTNVDEYMMASDILITKAGPGTICEAMILGVPLILSSFLPGQEEGNVPFVVNNGLGLYTEVPEDMGRMCLELLSDEARLAAMSKAAKAMSKPGATRLIAQDICKISFREKPDFHIADLV